MKTYSKLFITLLLLPTFNHALPELSQAVKDKLNEFHPWAYSTRETIYNTYQLSADCLLNDVPGDFVECGVAAGVQIAAMSYACQQYYDIDRKIHLFDSFEGIPLAGPNDTEQPGVGRIAHSVDVKNLEDLLVSSNDIYPQLCGAAKCSVDHVRSLMQWWNIQPFRHVYHKGWFQHTLPSDADEIKAIAVLRLDGDLYESTKVCLEYLYPKISKGGYIIIDDYGSLSGCRKAIHEYLKKHNIKPTIIDVPGGLGPVYWQVQ